MTLCAIEASRDHHRIVDALCPNDPLPTGSRGPPVAPGWQIHRMPGHPCVVRYSSFATIVRDGECPARIRSVRGVVIDLLRVLRMACAVFIGSGSSRVAQVVVSDLSAPGGMLPIASARSLGVL